MTKLEQFALVTAIIGLISDIIALITFFGGLWGTNQQDAINSNSGLPVLAQIIMGLIVVYGWFMISWVLLRRRIVHSKKHTMNGEMVFLITFGIGILVLPILLGLWFAIAYTNIEGQTEELRENSIIHATQTAQAFEATITADSSVRIPANEQPKTVTELIDREKEYIWPGYVFGGIFLLLILFICISGALYFLMPFVYPDIHHPDIKEDS